MTEKTLERYYEEDREKELEIKRHAEECVLAPIVEALGIDGDRLERVNSTPCQTAVSCIDHIERMQNRLKDLKAYNAELQTELDTVELESIFSEELAEKMGM